MNRLEALQKIIDKKKYKSYLEVGVAAGSVLCNLKGLDKVYGVDIELLYPMSVYKLRQEVDDQGIFEMSSDDFFKIFKEKVDLIFIDAAHSCRQVAKDINNSLKIINPGGIIMLHDCNPPHKAAATAAESYEKAAGKAGPGWNGEWCGDVWKIVLLHHDLVVLDCDYGLGLLKNPTIIPCYDVFPVWIEDLNYYDLEKNRVEMLKLKPVEYLDEFLK